MFHCRDDSYAAARIPNGSCHAAQHAGHDGHELRFSAASRPHDHAGLWQWDVSDLGCLSEVTAGATALPALPWAERAERGCKLKRGYQSVVGRCIL